MSDGMRIGRRRFLGLTAQLTALVIGRTVGAAVPPAAMEAQLRSIVVERALIVDDPWVLMHAVLPIGIEARHGDELILDLIMRKWLESVSRADNRYPAFPLGVEAHPNHFLEIMYAIGVPADRAFAGPLGTTTRAELYAGAQALFSPAVAGSELSWTISIFSAEMPPDRDRFVNADGRAFTVNAIVEAATQAAEQGYADTFAAMRGEKPYGRSALQQFPCNGTHAVHGVVNAVANGYRARDLQARVQKLLQASLYRLTAETALIDTHLGGAGTPLEVLNADAAKLQLIGHTLENLALARRHGVYTPTAGGERAIAAGRRELAGISGRLVGEHDLAALGQRVPRAYAVLLGDVCHALHAISDAPGGVHGGATRGSPRASGA